MEFPKKFDSEAAAFEGAEQSANNILTEFLAGSFPPQAREVFDKAISRINILEGIELKCKQLVYFGPRYPGRSMPDNYPKYVRITEDGSTKWNNTYVRCVGDFLSFGAKDEVTDIFQLQKDIERFKLTTLILDYKDDDKKHRVTLSIEKPSIYLYGVASVATRQTDEKIASDFQKIMDSFIENKGYVLKPKKEHGSRATNVSKDPDKSSNQILMDEDLQKRIKADIEHMDELKQAQYEGMLEEERNAILAEIERREADDPNYRRPDWISVNEKSRSFGDDFQNGYPDDRFSNEDRFQDDIRRDFSRFP